MPREISLVVIHCSASKDGASLFEGRMGDGTFKNPADVINRWHAARGFKRAPQWLRVFNPELRSIGYHFVIGTNGGQHTGRHLDEIGAHVLGNNRNSIGICMIGTERFTDLQWHELGLQVCNLADHYDRELVAGAPPKGRSPRDTIHRGELYVCGHRDLSPDQDNDGLVESWEWTKTCPGFDVAAWMTRGMKPDPSNVFLTEAAA